MIDDRRHRRFLGLACGNRRRANGGRWPGAAWQEQRAEEKEQELGRRDFQLAQL